MIADNYWFPCPMCGKLYGANDEQEVYDEVYDDAVCRSCKSELDAERHSLAYAKIGEQ